MQAFKRDPSLPAGLNRVHMGCGLTHLEGWINCDGSSSARMAQWPKPISGALLASGLVRGDSKRFLRFLRDHPVAYVNAHNTWPFPTNSVDLIYSSHVIDCFTAPQQQHFVRQCFRVLKPGGAIRLAGRNLNLHVQHYLRDKNSERLVESVSHPNPSDDRLLTRIIKAIWPEKIYVSHLDFGAYQRLLNAAGFTDIANLPAGKTTLQHTDPLNLWQRQGESLYVEARKPSEAAKPFEVV